MKMLLFQDFKSNYMQNFTVKISPFFRAKNPIPVRATFDVVRKSWKCLISVKLLVTGTLLTISAVLEAFSWTFDAKKQTASIR